MDVTENQAAVHADVIAGTHDCSLHLFTFIDVLQPICSCLGLLALGSFNIVWPSTQSTGLGWGIDAV